MTHLLALIGPVWLYHPLGYCPAHQHWVDCRSYNFWSGIGGYLPWIVGLISGTVAAWRLYRQARQHLQCHADTCRRIGIHHVQGTPYRVCWTHHPELGHAGHEHHRVPHSVIVRHHAERRPPGESCR